MVPVQGSLRISISPQCISMVLRTMVRPRPTRKLLVLNSGSQIFPQILRLDANTIVRDPDLSPVTIEGGFHFNDALFMVQACIPADGLEGVAQDIDQ